MITGVLGYAKKVDYMDSYTIMSFNLKNLGVPAFFHRRAEAVRKQILLYEPDLVAIQEYADFMNNDLSNLGSKYQLVVYGRGRVSEKGEECGFLIKKGRFDHIDTEVFWLSETPTIPGSNFKGSIFPRIVVVASLKDGNRSFVAANTHLDHLVEAVRLRQSMVLASVLKENFLLDRLVLTGDFNAGRSASCLDALQSLTGLREIIPNPDGPTVRELPGISMRKDPIDHFFCGKGIQVNHCRILKDKFDGIYPSDHYPVLCNVSLKKLR